MSLYGALAENTRRNERVERGQATVTGSLVITVPGPMRQITAAEACAIINAAPGLTAAMVTVGNIGSGGNNANQFTIFVWMPTSSANPTLIASTSPILVQWFAWGNLSGGAGF